MVLVWEAISDLPHDWSSLSDGELVPLLRLWNDQRAVLQQNNVLAAFTERLTREWSIETGQIEGIYDIDKGITQTLIERGISADLIPFQPGQKLPELIAAIIQDHAAVLEGLFQFVKGHRPISKSYIHELHAALMRHQDTTLVRDQFGNLFESKLLKGKYKERANNPKKPDGSMHQYCPPEQVDSEMERLLAMHTEHVKKGVPVEVDAAWLHHRFTQIHPYQDGNGRVARALASLLFIKAGWFPVVVTRDDRLRYIDALEGADQGDLRSLVSFLVDVQKTALFQAMQPIAGAVGGASMQPRPLNRWGQTLEYANRLVNFAAERLGIAAESLRHSYTGYEFDTASSDWSSWGEVYKLLPYKPNVIAYEQGRKLIIQAPTRPYTKYIEVNAHAIGSTATGLIGIAVVFWKGLGGSEGIERASKGIFQVNYSEPYENTERRFRVWLEESLETARSLWRKSL
jgi:Fic family protein